MTLGDFLKRVDVEKDKNKMILLDLGEGWSNEDDDTCCYDELKKDVIIELETMTEDQ